ncbi:tRNA (adenine-N1)-methyltransferase [Thermodesulfobacterium hydrogeniphilum]|uniref:tRNA (adenine-N1)-methyltransferase n=1 Tax=Thermodesulfobacterium hydrogeniphilum TaxID=161156 RepID=UPI00057203F6|nr:tRNA (adenine-N1)-methyltransferase [Thermodesulfobacterium hydrogeniphilum]
MPVAEGNYVLLLTSDGRSYLVEVKDTYFHTHKDSVYLKELIGKEFGEIILGKNGTKFYLVKPSLYDFLMKVERATQVIYPKDIGYILQKLDVGPGKVVLECGGGSGALTTAFAFMVGEDGKVISYEKEEKFQKIAQKNLKKIGLLNRVIFKNKEVKEAFEEKEVEAVFLDLKEPWVLLKAAWEALKGGHFLGILVPTTNQVSRCLTELEKYPFVDIEVVEILLRKYKTNPERLRPEDRMVAHTGFLIFAKKVWEK